MQRTLNLPASASMNQARCGHRRFGIQSGRVVLKPTPSRSSCRWSARRCAPREGVESLSSTDLLESPAQQEHEHEHGVSPVVDSFVQISGEHDPVQQQQLDVLGHSPATELGVGANNIVHAEGISEACQEGGTLDLSDVADRALEEQLPTLATLPKGDGVFADNSPTATAYSTKQLMREVAALAVPALGAVIADPLMSLIDTACVGRISSVHLASLGPNTAIFNFIFQTFTFLGIATTNVIASNSVSVAGLSDEEQLNRKKYSEKMLCYALQIATAIGLGLTLVLEVWGPAMLTAMGASGELLAPAVTYLRIRALASPMVLIMCVCQGVSLGLQDAMTPLKIFALAGVGNLIGDVILTLGLGWGVAGAAWATLAAQAIGCVLFLHVLRKRGNDPEALAKGAVPLRWRGFPTLDILKPFAAMSATLVQRSSVQMCAYSALAFASMTLGTAATAAHQVAMQVFWFLSFFCEPLSVAAQSLIARDLSDRAKVEPLARVLLKASVAFGGVLAACCGVLLLGMPWLFTADAAVQALVAKCVPLCALCVATVPAVMVCDGVAIGSSDFGHLPRVVTLATAAIAGLLRVAWWLGAGAEPVSGLLAVWQCCLLFFALRFVQHAGHALSNRGSVLSAMMGFARRGSSQEPELKAA